MPKYNILCEKKLDNLHTQLQQAPLISSSCRGRSGLKVRKYCTNQLFLKIFLTGSSPKGPFY